MRLDRPNGSYSSVEEVIRLALKLEPLRRGRGQRLALLYHVHSH